jgi:hypothetical protein
VNTPRKNVIASVLAKLRNEATTQGLTFNQVLQFYAMERFLDRLSRSPHVDGVLLKGALLLKTVGIPNARPTMDIDLLRQGKANTESLTQLVRDCAAIKIDSDAVEFDPKSVRAEEIAKDATYQGTRVLIKGPMGNVRLNVQIDFGVGDVVVPGPRVIEYPTLLDAPAVRLRAYPVEAAIAEKFQAMVELDTANSRMKDFYDIWTYSRHLEFEGAMLARSIAATFEHRGTDVPTQPPIGLTSAYFEANEHVLQWRAFVRRIGERDLADAFPRVVGEIAAFVMPPATAAAHGQRFAHRWQAGGPWITNGAHP